MVTLELFGFDLELERKQAPILDGGSFCIIEAFKLDPEAGQRGSCQLETGL
jgi:hypothetical protein